MPIPIGKKSAMICLLLMKCAAMLHLQGHPDCFQTTGAYNKVLKTYCNDDNRDNATLDYQTGYDAGYADGHEDGYDTGPDDCNKSSRSYYMRSMTIRICRMGRIG